MEPEVINVGPHGPRLERWPDGRYILWVRCWNHRCNRLFNPRESEYERFCSPACFAEDEADCPYCHPEAETPCETHEEASDGT